MLFRSVAKLLLKVTDEAGTETVYLLNKFNSSYSVYSLNQNELYKVELLYRAYKVENGEYVPGDEVSVGTITVKTGNLTAKAETERETDTMLFIRLYMNGIRLSDAKAYIKETYGVVDEESGAASELTRKKEISITEAAFTSVGQLIEYPISSTTKSVEISKIEGADGTNVSISYYQMTGK